ncbi:unnamed protein product [Caenorhabditis brenneri]
MLILSSRPIHLPTIKVTVTHHTNLQTAILLLSPLGLSTIFTIPLYYSTMAHHQLPKLTDMDFEVDYSRKRKLSQSGSSTTSSNSSSSNCSTNSTGLSKNSHPATPALQTDFLQRKRTNPAQFCPKAKAPTKRFQPKCVKESKAPKIAYVARPLEHITQRPLMALDNHPNMAEYRQYRQLEMEKAQAAKLTGAPEEPPRKKKAPLRRKEIWEQN